MSAMDFARVSGNPDDDETRPPAREEDQSHTRHIPSREPRPIGVVQSCDWQSSEEYDAQINIADPW